MTEECKDKSSSFILKLIILVILIIVIFVFIKTDYFKSNIKEPYIDPLISTVKNSFGFIFGEFGQTKKILTGEEDILGLEPELEVKEKTGLEIGGLKAFGLKSDDEFGVDAEVIVHKFDENIKELNVFVSCELISDEFGGPVRGDITDATFIKNFDGERGFIENYKDKGEKTEKIRCTFPADKRTIINPDIKLNLQYSLSSEVKLDVFVVPKNIFEEYEGELDLAFKELDGGTYKEYTSKIEPKMEYAADVKIEEFGLGAQPLTTKDYTLYFELINDNEENKVNVKSFDIILPGGIEFSDCNYRDNAGFLGDLNEELNLEDRISDRYACKLNVNENVFGGSGGGILKLDQSIVGKLDYDIILKKEVTLKLND